MAEYSTPEERTELPTERRMGQLRKDGAIFFSHELVHVISILTCFYILHMMWNSVFTSFETVLVGTYTLIGNPEPLTVHDLYRGFLGLLYLLAPKVFVIVFTIACCSSLAVMLQTNWNVKQKKIE